MSTSGKEADTVMGGVGGVHTEVEITSQPDVWRDCLSGLRVQVGSLPLDLQGYDLVLFIGCGSTHYLSLWAASHLQATRAGHTAALPSSEIMLFPRERLPSNGKVLLVAISRSAETQETVRSVEYFTRERIGESLSITCYPDRRLARMTNWVLSTPSAQEESVVQTRSFSSMMLAVAALIDRDVPAGLEDRLSAAGRRMLDMHSGLALKLATDLSLNHFVLLGSGPLFGLASEAALKMKEMALTTAESYHTLEVRHGPMSTIGKHTLVVGLLSRQAREAELKVMRDLKSLGATTLAISDYALPDSPHFIDYQIQLPDEVPTRWRDPLYLVIPHVMALERARANGLDPDHPPHLDAVVRSV